MGCQALKSRACICGPPMPSQRTDASPACKPAMMRPASRSPEGSPATMPMRLLIVHPQIALAALRAGSPTRLWRPAGVMDG